jgi:hypothetical protein
MIDSRLYSRELYSNEKNVVDGIDEESKSRGHRTGRRARTVTDEAVDSDQPSSRL